MGIFRDIRRIMADPLLFLIEPLFSSTRTLIDGYDPVSGLRTIFYKCSWNPVYN
jgi:hypothetical protein